MMVLRAIKINWRSKAPCTRKILTPWLKVYDAEGIYEEWKDLLIGIAQYQTLHMVTIVFAISDLEKRKLSKL
jgi:hypothetical protein